MEHSSGLSRLLPAIYRDSSFRHWLKITAIAFVIMVVGSYVAGLLLPDLAAKIYDWMAQTAQSSGMQNDDGSFSAFSIFLHNFQAMMFTILYGLLPFLYLPALLLGINAMSLGFVGAHLVNTGVPITLYLAGILPHGIFELTALVLALSAGFFLCDAVTHRLRTKEKGIIRTAFPQTAQLLFVHVAPLLLIAAFVEAYVTPAILGALMG